MRGKTAKRLRKAAKQRPGLTDMGQAAFYRALKSLWKEKRIKK